ncbi:MAG: hypothetical protein VX609_02340 [Verrucomicrobiota bacterium]|nr:hypothetical protein [Verrucomicrobiota bacterium]
MNSVSPGHANIHGSVDRHEIGKNGSFWMPEKSKFIKAQGKTKNNSSQFQPPKSKPDSSKTIQPRFAKQASSVSIKNSSVKPDNLNQINNDKVLKSPILQNKNLRTSSKFSTRQPANASTIPEIRERVGASSLNNLHSVRHGTHFQQARPSKNRSSFSSPVDDMPKSEVNDRFFDDNSRQDRGMENAFKRYMSATASHYPHDLSISSPKSEEDTNLTDRLVEYFGGKILPKISTSKFNGKKIYRFALDLPGGNSVGIRLQCDESKSTLCYIAPKNSVATAISKITEAMKSFLTTENKQLDVHHFESFSQMDLHFKNYS